MQDTDGAAEGGAVALRGDSAACLTDFMEYPEHDFLDFV
jgi:hypothetical protein